MSHFILFLLSQISYVTLNESFDFGLVWMLTSSSWFDLFGFKSNEKSLFQYVVKNLLNKCEL